jgi:hypothetical protein
VDKGLNSGLGTSAFSLRLHISLACRRLALNDTIPLSTSPIFSLPICLSGLASGTHIHGFDATHRNEPK